MDSIGSKPAEPQGVSKKLCLACNREFLDAGISHCPHDKTQLVNLGRDEIQDWIGKTINGKYKLLEAVGKGGMGTVYKAEQLALGRHVAVKMLKAQLSEDKVSVKRFEQEATASAALQHPNLIMLHDHGMIDDKQPYIVMEFLEGESLAMVIRELGAINPVRCLRIFSQVMDGLKIAHLKGVVHRDIKPSNIILCKMDNQIDVVKVVDFGLAKLMPWSGKESQHLTKTGEVFGSPIYMSPEQCQGKKLEPSSDIYSVGVTLYEALTGKPPFKGRNVVETASMHIANQPSAFELIRPDLRLSNKLQAVIFKALDKDPVRRYLSMDEFKQALTEAISGPGANQGFRTDDEVAEIPVAATQPVKRADLENYKAPKITARQAEQQQEEHRRRSGILALIIGVVVLLSAGGGYWWFTSQKPTNPASTTGTIVPVRPEVTGQVYYLNLSPIGKPGEVRRGYTVNAVHIMPSDGEPLVKLKADFKRGGMIDNLRIGETWSCKTTEPVKEVTFKEAPNKIIYAYNSLLSFLESLDQNDDQWKKYVDTLANSDAFSGLQNSFKKYKLKIRPNEEQNLQSKAVDDAYTNRPLPQCVKVIEADDESVVFILDKRMIYNENNKEIDHPLYQKFTLNSRGTEWHIGRMFQETEDPAEWDKY
ncbi:MAG: protein kinase [Candidatus Obscuribacterales bacterium]|nr:protein kinase [Candidatus Obscuribacterales bacterium]